MQIPPGYPSGAEQRTRDFLSDRFLAPADVDAVAPQEESPCFLQELILGQSLQVQRQGLQGHHAGMLGGDAGPRAALG